MMDIDLEVVAVLVALADQAGLVGFVDARAERLTLADELAADIDVGGDRAHGEAGEQTAFDQRMRIVAQDFAVLAGARLGFVGIDDQIGRTAVALLRHEGPFQSGREARAAAAAQAGGLHLVDDPVAPLGDDPGRAVPMAAGHRALQRLVEHAVEVGEDAIFVAEASAFTVPHRSLGLPAFRSACHPAQIMVAALRPFGEPREADVAGLAEGRSPCAAWRSGVFHLRGVDLHRRSAVRHLFRPSAPCWRRRKRLYAPPSPAWLALTGDGDFTAALVSAASVFGLAASTAALTAPSAATGTAAALAPPGFSRISLSRVDFSTAFSFQRRQARLRRRENPVDLRSRRHRGPFAGLERVDDLGKPFGGQILVGVLEDHHHRGVHAGAEALDLFPGQRALGVGVELVVMDLRAADIDQRFGAAQHAGRRATDLDMGARSDRLQLELRVEGRDFQDADQGMSSMSATCSIAALVTQPSCSCARISSGMTADCSRPFGYFFSDLLRPKRCLSRLKANAGWLDADLLRDGGRTFNGRPHQTRCRGSRERRRRRPACGRGT